MVYIARHALKRVHQHQAGMNKESQHSRLAQVKNEVLQRSLMQQPLTEEQRDQQMINKNNGHRQRAEDIQIGAVAHAVEAQFGWIGQL